MARRNYKPTDYRIVKTTYKSGSIRFSVQWKRRFWLFWIWQTVKGSRSNQESLSLDYFNSKEEAQDALKLMMKAELDQQSIKKKIFKFK